MTVHLLLKLIFFCPGAFAAPQTDRYVDVQAELARLAASKPEVVTLFTLGTSDSGIPIQGLQIGDGPNPQLVVGTHHGNEYGATEVGRAFARSAVESPLPGTTLYVIPVLNTAGYDRRVRTEEAQGRGWDPNRDYPGPCGTEGPFHLQSTALLARFLEEKQIVTAATLHTKLLAVVWPWGFAADPVETQHTDLFKGLAQASTLESGYRIGNSTDLLYPAPGTFEDYAFWKHGIWALLFEIGSTHKPSDFEVDLAIRGNVPGLRRMLAQAPRERAERHAFTGKCVARSAKQGWVDRHDE